MRRRSAVAMAADVRAGRVTPVALVEQALARLEQCDEQARAFVLVDADGALRAARALPAQGGPLHGVPVAVKDLFDVVGQVTRAGSRLPAGSPATRDAEAVRRLRAAGAIVLGRTRTHEFAWGITTQHDELGGTRNPWDTGRIAGGSSGGSAAAVAAGVVPLALGTDTGGSIRLPAAWCGLVGHKPSYGLVPLSGVLPLAPSLDCVGALVGDVADARLALEVLSGRRLERLPTPVSLRGCRLGSAVLPGAPGAADLVTPGVRAALSATAERAVRAGAQLRPVELPAGLLALYAVVQGAQALAVHRRTGRWPRHANAYGPDVRRHLERAEQLSAAEVAVAGQQRAGLREWVGELFARIDLLLMPVAAAGPPRTVTPTEAATGPVRDAVLPWTVLANLCGLPACAVPAGVDEDDLPVGVQVVGPPGADDRVLAAAQELVSAAGR